MASTRGRDPAVEEEFLGALYKGGELLASGKIVEARDHLEKAHGLAPKNEKAQNLLGLTYFKLGLFDRASEVYEKLVNENPADATLRVNLGLVYLKTNNLERCIKEFETATDLEPAHKKAHNYLGLALAQQGTYVKAKEHFELAGSEQMAEKMTRAIANQSSPSGIHTPVERQVPKTVMLGEDDPSASSVYRAMKIPVPEKPAPPAPANEEEVIEVMSDEEVPSEAFVVPDDALVPASSKAPLAVPENDDALNSDWGAAMRSSPSRPSIEKKALRPAPDEMRFAEDEGPSSDAELPMLDAVDVEASEPMPEASAVGGIEATVEVMPDTSLDAATEVEVEADELLDDDAFVDAAPEPVPVPAPAAIEPPPPAPVPSVPSPAWLTEAQEPPAAEAPPAEALSVSAPLTSGQTAPPLKRKWAAADAEVSSWGATSSSAETIAEEPLAAEAAPAIAPIEMPVLGPVTSPSQITEAPTEEIPASSGNPSEQLLATDESAQEPPAAEEMPSADDSWATGAAESAAQTVAAEALPADDGSWAAEQSEPAESESMPSADDASWATGGAVAAVPPQPEVLPNMADDDSWATGAAGAEEPQPVRTEWATEQVADVEASASWAANSQPALEVAAQRAPAPEPSAPLPITVEEPADAPAPLPPAGYSAMQPQRLVDLGASGAWVHEPSAGPFHLSTDGLAITIAGEMLMRMHGLIAVVGSVNVNPESRRRRGRPTQEPFGAGPNQLQRVTGNGVVYLEPGKSKFHAVDLTDQNGINIDDDGAYLREELVFAFEEPISYENGKLSNDAQALELAHLKGTGRVLLQLDGTLRAMPIPVAAPLVVPVHRVVGWFGRVTPRLMGFGGRGAVELTGEGYALLGTPSGA